MTASSHGQTPPGLKLYLFEYPPFHVSKEEWMGSINPAECFLEGPFAAIDFAHRFGACRVIDVLTGEIRSVP